GEASASESPSINSKFASEATTHYRREHAHLVSSINDFCARDFAGDSAHVLRGGVQSEIVAIPLRYLAVSFEAAMSDYRGAILALADDFGLLKHLVRISVSLLGKLFCVVAGLVGGDVRNEVRKFLVANFNGASSVARLLFGFRGDGCDFMP